MYSLFQHEYLGYLFESFAVQLDEQSRYTFEHQNISHKNAKEFAAGLDARDYQLIRLMDAMQQDVIIYKFSEKKVRSQDFFKKVFESTTEKQIAVKEAIEKYLEEHRAHVLSLLHDKPLFEMSNDGEPTGMAIEVLPQKATVLFHFRRNDDNTHYFPTIKYDGQKVDFQYKGAYIICKEPAWMVLENKLYSFEKEIDGHKLQPFLNKKFIVIPKKVEDSYYQKFVAPLVASFDVYAKGFEINTVQFDAIPHLLFYEVNTANGDKDKLSNGNHNNVNEAFQSINGNNDKIGFKLTFRYNQYYFDADQQAPVSVSTEKKDDTYTFHRVRRDTEKEKDALEFLNEKSMLLDNGPVILPKYDALQWISQYKSQLDEKGIVIEQKGSNGKKYFLGKSSIDITIRENIDWFDINAQVKFGDYYISFAEIRKYILNKQQEFLLPKGEVAIIPEAWFTEYTQLFAFAEDQNQEIKLKKHHIALIQDLRHGNLAQVTMTRKLEKLRDFSEIEEQPLPKHFKGKLRPYQKAGYNWLCFLKSYNFGGCLADDMGLGKTIQTLALLQRVKEENDELGNVNSASLLIMPTSLIYNWEMEARRFTPKLRILNYTGTNRDKNVAQFKDYDLVLTSYGITRLDVDLLKSFYFNYLILDESQAIKNPDAHIAHAVKSLKSKYRLILTGTPIENSTLDLWSQISFINPGLLGRETFFRNEFLNPIEKKGDVDKTQKLYTLIKPFVMRRQKWQVATELPKKIESVKYCSMTDEQEQLYEEIKSFYRNKVLNMVEEEGIGKSHFLLLQGLTQLRQIANHPKMVDDAYTGYSGKMEDVMYMITNAIGKGHKILIFSQFVKHLTILKQHLTKENMRFAYLDGGTKNRQEQVELFQENDQIPLFLISLRAGGLGLNLTKADYVFILDPWWNPAVEAQAVDRAHRIGQKNTVFTYKFITKNTVEEKILKLQHSKLRLANDLISTEESFVKSLSRDDIAAILS